MADIFISYASEDRDRVIPIVKALGKKGWSMFWDSKSIPVGKTWRQFIKEGLNEARCVLVLWSEKSIDSEWVNEEADHGKAKRILVPALIDDVRPPVGFGQIQAARLIGWKGKSSHADFQRLFKALTDLLGPPEPASQRKIANSIGMEFVLIPAGSFTMGSRNGYDNPQHEVKISQSFYLQTTEVSQGQWRKVMGLRNNPSFFNAEGDDCPVDRVSWEDARQFIKKLNQIDKTKHYRLPNEAEWEYACRAGSETEFFFGDDKKLLREFAWLSHNSGGKTHPVGKKKPNAWGLYDMYGNVFEWVQDDFHGIDRGAPADGRAWVDNPRGSTRVVRGGSWQDSASFCQSRIGFGAGDLRNYVGFRAAMSVPINP